MIVLTGGAGFIGSCLLARLNELGIRDVLVVDRMTPAKRRNLKGKRYSAFVDKQAFLRQLRAGKAPKNVSALIHLGACTSTTETDADYLRENNLEYTIDVVEWALGLGARVIYASSAATYGGGEQGYGDDPARIERLRPLNLYAHSKQDFDLWAKKYGLLRRMLGFKFFNVFGPNEWHKGGMRSLVYKAYAQARDQGVVTLFKSERSGIRDGEQTRDFIYVKDVVEVLIHGLRHADWNGLYNLGTGKARNWNDLATAVFKAMGQKPSIAYIPLPAALRGKYQYHTQADMRRLFRDAKRFKFTPLEKAVEETVRHHIIPGRPW